VHQFVSNQILAYRESQVIVTVTQHITSSIIKRDQKTKLSANMTNCIRYILLWIVIFHVFMDNQFLPNFACREIWQT